jgi:hypothetical protein
VVRRPAFEFNLLAILQADLAIDHVRGGVISSFAITNPALRAGVMPELNLGLFSDQFHKLNLLGWAAHGAKREPSIYGIRLESAKQDVHLRDPPGGN